MQKLILDTNVLARFLLGDIPDLHNEAKKIIASIESGKALAEVSILVIDELVWTMESYYKIERNSYLSNLRTLLGLRGITIKEVNKAKFLKIMAEFSKSKFDFTDLYLLFTKKPGQKIMGFDKQLLKYGI